MQKQIERWLEEYIIGLNLCPFAKKPWQLGQVKIRIVESDKEEDLTQALLEELSTLIDIKRSVIETTLLVHPRLLSDFDDFLAYIEWTQELLEQSGVEGLIQIVGFHPDYYFAETDKDDHGNFTNRSPFPLLHLIREESVEEAVEHFPDIKDIPARNVKLLRSMKKEELIKYTNAKNDIT